MATKQLQRLYDKLCREQSQAEHSTELHPAREARRLPEGRPADAFRALAAHAAQLSPELARAIGPAHRAGNVLGRSLGKALSASRQLVIDRLTEAERSYRVTLLGVKHGLDCARLLSEVASAVGEVAVASWCQRMIAERTPLVTEAESALAWFAAHPEQALH